MGLKLIEVIKGFECEYWMISKVVVNIIPNKESIVTLAVYKSRTDRIAKPEKNRMETESLTFSDFVDKTREEIYTKIKETGKFTNAIDVLEE